MSRPRIHFSYAWTDVIGFSPRMLDGLTTALPNLLHISQRVFILAGLLMCKQMPIVA